MPMLRKMAAMLERVATRGEIPRPADVIIAHLRAPAARGGRSGPIPLARRPAPPAADWKMIAATYRGTVFFDE